MSTGLSSSPLSVRLTSPLSEALGRIRDHRKLPLFPRPTASEVVRSLIAEEHTRLLSICPQCDGQTSRHPDPTMTSVRFCPDCKESVGLETSQ
jgi:hypothetical protein